MNHPQCWHCRYYAPSDELYPNWEEDQRNGYGQGTCRRRCPVAQKPDEDERVVLYGYWPVVLSGDFCGEFRPRPQTAPDAATSACCNCDGRISPEKPHGDMCPKADAMVPS